MHFLSIVIPCYNEAENIHLIINRLNEILLVRHDVEVILVNNGSTDDSKDILDAEIANHNSQLFKVVNIEENQGYGYGILEGLKACKGDLLSWTHADMQTDPEDVLKAFDLYKQQGREDILVKGKRKNRRLLERFFTWGMQIIVGFVLKEKLDDINAQPKLFSRDFYEKQILNKAPNDFSLDLFLLYQAKKNRYDILEIPVYFFERKYGEAKGGGTWKTRIKLIKRTLDYIFDLQKSFTT